MQSWQSIAMIIPLLSAPSWSQSIPALTEGIATHFQSIGTPYGACGVPESVLFAEGATNYVALNVFNAPKDYRPAGDFGKRPLSGAAEKWIGAYQEGKNCGRWVEITLGDDCNGNNGGEKNHEICSGGTGWFADERNGATLKAIVTDECSDDNAWCRDVPGHLDIRTASLNQFAHLVADTIQYIAPYAFYENSQWITKNFNNRKIQWKYIDTPISGKDINIHYTEGSEKYWQRILITNLPNGIHGVEQWDGGQWIKAEMSGLMGQMWILPKPELPEPLQIRILDANDQWVYEGRNYFIKFPNECGSKCTAGSTKIAYETLGGIDPANLSLSSQPRKHAKFENIPSLFKTHVYNLKGQYIRK